MATRSKLCTMCNGRKPLTQFHSDKNRSDGRVSHCATCYKKTYRNGGMVESDYNQRVYSNTIEMMRKRFGNE